MSVALQKLVRPHARFPRAPTLAHDHLAYPSARPALLNGRMSILLDQPSADCSYSANYVSAMSSV